MKTITLTPNEFYQFKELAQKFRIMFTCTIAMGMIHVEADINILEKFPLLFLIVILLIAYFIYTYLQKIHITNPNVDMAYNINKINYFNY